jgi:hypothetical protein
VFQLENAKGKILLERTTKGEKTMVQRKSITRKLNVNQFIITFTKQDGTVRVLRGTRNLDLIPKKYHPKGNKPDHLTLVTVFDLDAKGWRSFYPQSVLSVERA